MAKFGSLLKECRTLLGLTMKEVAYELGCSINYISGIERGNFRPPVLDKVAKLEWVLRIDDGRLMKQAVKERTPQITRELVESYREALLVYANEDNWLDNPATNSKLVVFAIENGPKIAQEVLAKG